MIYILPLSEEEPLPEILESEESGETNNENTNNKESVDKEKSFEENKLSEEDIFKAIQSNWSEILQKLDIINSKLSSFLEEATIKDFNPLNTTIKLEQTLIDKGRDAEYSKNLIGLELAKARLLKKEQDILYSAIDAFTSLKSNAVKLFGCIIQVSVRRKRYSQL